MTQPFVSDHPVLVDKLTRMRSASTNSAEFRKLLADITIMMGYEATRDLPTKRELVETPVCEAKLPVLDDVEIAIVPILRAAVGMVTPMLELFPDAHVGYAGLKRNEETHEPESYYWNMPDGIEDMYVLLVDPMLATGGSAIATVDLLKEYGCNCIRMICIVAAPEGLKAMQEAHPDVTIYAAALDEGLNEDAYIVPGLGDAGDRIHATVRP